MLTHRIVAYLISLAVGYWVLTLAAKEKNTTRNIGLVIGWIIIAVSFIGPLCLAGSSIMCHEGSASCPTNSSYSCPWQGGSSHCPDMMGSTDRVKDKGMDKAKTK